MKFKRIEIKNFRNFEDVRIYLENKNICFGLNDVGKTNFLFALRYIFDKEIRKKGFIESDFHNMSTRKQIQILVEIDISDELCEDNQKIRAKLGGGASSDSDVLFIKLIGKYDVKESSAIPILFWGTQKNRLVDMHTKGYMYDIDYVFDVIFIDSYVDLYAMFKRSINTLIKNEDAKDKKKLAEIKGVLDNLNKKISSLSGVKYFEDKITPEFNKYQQENISIAVKSEIAVTGLYSNVVPYIKQDGDENLYPTSGDGRKKLLAYSMFDLLSEENSERKVQLFLIEEPENSLHRSMQIAISNILFSNDKYKYLFVATHSPYILYEMDNVNLIRIYCESKIKSESVLYKVPKEYQDSKMTLNRNLSEALFSNRVLLIEGPSENLLFTKILSFVEPYYESKGFYILMVSGIGFKRYHSILSGLEITTLIKTDNDLKSAGKKSKLFTPIGFTRCNGIIGSGILPKDKVHKNDIDTKRLLFNTNEKKITEIEETYGIYLSRVDLENDLDEIMHDNLVIYLDCDDPVKYLKSKKYINMNELANKLTREDCILIYNHKNFKCLKELIE